MKNANANVASAVQIDKPLLLNKDENAAPKTITKLKIETLVSKVLDNF